MDAAPNPMKLFFQVCIQLLVGTYCGVLLLFYPLVWLVVKAFAYAMDEHVNVWEMWNFIRVEGAAFKK